jgi:hypothetical protein
LTGVPAFGVCRFAFGVLRLIPGRVAAVVVVVVVVGLVGSRDRIRAKPPARSNQHVLCVRVTTRNDDNSSSKQAAAPAPAFNSLLLPFFAFFFFFFFFFFFCFALIFGV